MCCCLDSMLLPAAFFKGNNQRKVSLIGKSDADSTRRANDKRQGNFAPRGISSTLTFQGAKLSQVQVLENKLEDVSKA